MARRARLQATGALSRLAMSPIRHYCYTTHEGAGCCPPPLELFLERGSAQDRLQPPAWPSAQGSTTAQRAKRRRDRDHNPKAELEGSWDSGEMPADQCYISSRRASSVH